MHALTLAPTPALAGTVILPGSKSISNRVLLLAALASGRTEIRNLLDSDDVRHMIDALTALGVPVTRQDAHWLVDGRAGPLAQTDLDLSLHLGLAGTAYRPLAAALTLGRGRFVLDGTARMRERPVAPLVDGLLQLGAEIEYLGNEGYPPIRVIGTGLTGGRVRMRGDLSSQFLTSLLMSAPLAAGRVVIEIEGEQVSKPYLAITVHLMARFGVTLTHQDFQRFEIEPQSYRSPGSVLVEGDASSATYFLAAGAIAGGGVTVVGLGADSVQGDVAFLDVLEAMGAVVSRAAESITVRPGRLKGVDLDLNAIPDAAMTVAVLALFAEGRTTIRNIYNWRVKETDRLAAMSTELRKLGATVVEGLDFLSITPPRSLVPATIDTYGDHRMAMCFSLACLGGVPVTINDPECVSKTFPDYFERFESL
ncbi:MAG: 3-phosphoshikimate 1-carboxyvinyltransferase, partial [Pseudomonadales bacterium]